MKTKRISAIVTAVLLLGVGVTWALGYFEGQDPEVANMVQEAKQAMEEGAGPPSASQRDEFRKRMESFTPEQRQQAMRAMRPFMMQMIKKRMQSMLEGTPEEQNENISRFADMIVQRRSGGGGGPPGFGGPGANNLSEEERDQRIKGMLDRVPPEDRAVFMQAITKVNEELKSRGEEPVFR